MFRHSTFLFNVFYIGIMLNNVCQFNLRIYFSKEPDTLVEYRATMDKIKSLNLEHEVERILRGILESADLDLEVDVEQLI